MPTKRQEIPKKTSKNPYFFILPQFVRIYTPRPHAPVVRTLVDIHTLPVGARPHTLVAIIAVLVGVAPEDVVAAPGLGSAPSPAALSAGLVTSDLCQVVIVREREVGPVHTVRAALVVMAASQTVRVTAAGTLAVTTASLRATGSLTTVDISRHIVH